MKIKAFLIILLLSTLACLNSNDEGQPSISPEDAMATSVAATLTAAASDSQPGQAGTQALPSCQPQHPGTQSLQMPSALAVGSPIDNNLEGYVSRNYTKAYLRHLILSKEILGAQIASLQNLSLYLWLIRQSRHNIENGSFSEWKKTMTENVSRRL